MKTREKNYRKVKLKRKKKSKPWPKKNHFLIGESMEAHFEYRVLSCNIFITSSFILIDKII